MTAVLMIWLLAAVTLVLGEKTLDINKGVIVHLFEWKYSDIAKECEEFLASHGYKGIQISPPNENLVIPDRPWYERYQPVSYVLTTRSGTEGDLADMIRRCNNVGIRVFADVVFNHMTASADICQGTGGSICDEKSLSYPCVSYTKDNFHQPGCLINDYGNKHEVRNCELMGLHDLDQSQEYVRQKIADYLNHLTDLGMAGFRVDAAKHMDPIDLAAIYGKLHNLNTDKGFPTETKPLIYQEVISDSGVNEQEYTPLGLITDFKYGQELGRCFKGQNKLKWLQNYGLIFLLHHKDTAQNKYASEFMRYIPFTVFGAKFNCYSTYNPEFSFFLVFGDVPYSIVIDLLLNQKPLYL